MKNRLTTMLKADARRMLTTPRFYIFLAASLAMPVLILVMTAGVGGDAMAFSSVWDIIGSTGGMDAMAGMDMTGMCNINLIYFIAGVFTCLFVSDDFKSGYVKNLFTVRSRKGDYVASKTMLCFISGALMLLAFFLGSMIGGKIAGLSFGLGTLSVFNIAMCLLAKIFLMSLFSAIPVAVSVWGKQRTWLSVLLFLFAGMLLFMMIPMMTPLSSGIMNAGMCLAGGVLFSLGLGAASNFILKKEDLV